jgi:Flp pilus assembly protein TadG
MAGGRTAGRIEEDRRVRPRHARRDRRGAALVEAAIVVSSFLMLVFGMLDLGIVLFRTHVACEAARQGVRNAIVHGYLSRNNSTMNAWGPTPSYYPALTSRSLYSGSTSYTVQADDASDDLAGTIRPYLPGLDPSTVTIQIRWPDGDNDLGNRVTVTVSAPYQHFVPFIFADSTITIGASSTMTIVH